MNIDGIASSISRVVLNKTTLVVSGVILLLFIVATGFYSSSNNQGEVYTAVKEPLQQMVLFSGTVTPQSRVTLSFERAGKVAVLPFDVGDSVESGSIVAALDAAAANAAYQREKALLESEQANLDELLGGNRDEEVAITQAQLDQSTAVLGESSESLTSAMINAFTVVDTAMERTADPLFDDPTSATPTIIHGTTNRSLEILLENQRLQMEGLMTQWRKDVALLKSWQSHAANQKILSNTPTLVRGLLGAAILATTDNTEEVDLIAQAQTTRNRLVSAASFFQDLNLYTGNLSATSGLTQNQIDALIANVSLDRANIQTALASLSTKRESYISAETAVTVNMQQLELSTAGARVEDIAAQRAKIRAQQSAVQSANVEVSKHALRSPNNAVVTERFVEIGELITAGTDALTLDAAGSFEIEARVSELDVVLLEEGMEAVVTTDAYGPELSFNAILQRIDPAESVVDGVAGYGVVLTLSEDANILKAGMTANVMIEVILAEDALTIPAGLIERSSDGSYVYKLRDGKRERTSVTTGVEAIDGRIDVTSGLNEGDKIVPYEES